MKEKNNLSSNNDFAIYNDNIQKNLSFNGTKIYENNENNKSSSN